MEMAYGTPEMDEIWSDLNTLDLWVRVELAVIAAQRRAGLNPHPATFDMARPSVIDWKDRLARGEHEVLAFLTCWGHPGAHLGMTSSDLVDTALALRLQQVDEVLRQAGRDVDYWLDRLIMTGRVVDRVARTHGQWGPLTKWSEHWHGARIPFRRAVGRLVSASPLPGHLSGPIGTYSKWLPPHVARDAAKHLGLNRLEATGAQAVSRDVYVEWAQRTAALAVGCAQLARVVREGVASDVNELHLSRGVTSSAMPHKSNPTQAERIEGLAVLANAQAAALSHAVVWWGERDLVHSSVERVTLPLLSSLAHRAMTETADLLSQVTYNLDGTGLTRERAALDPGHPLNTWKNLCEAQASGATYLDARIIATNGGLK